MLYGSSLFLVVLTVGLGSKPPNGFEWAYERLLPQRRDSTELADDKLIDIDEFPRYHGNDTRSELEEETCSHTCLRGFSCSRYGCMIAASVGAVSAVALLIVLVKILS